ncbi:hypothetical protein COLO4_36024 [Corchorus olitorius]|uniref:Uncharacterized protein n=1 Tax=Corchorus olitorius TaxID=93759 RepID=A0A1R3GBH2_9ROSI|nr:hypothetical protein COLO4_36024 [Corchorus olitorius]
MSFPFAKAKNRGADLATAYSVVSSRIPSLSFALFLLNFGPHFLVQTIARHLESNEGSGPLMSGIPSFPLPLMSSFAQES